MDRMDLDEDIYENVDQRSDKTTPYGQKERGKKVSLYMLLCENLNDIIILKQ